MIKVINKKGTIGITIVMLVFCMLMAVSMSYHKTLQTERIIKSNVNYSDRAMDAAFSGVNYAMAVIQSEKAVFSTDATHKNVLFLQPGSTSAGNIVKISQWITLATTSTFSNYYDEDRKDDKKQLPPYRFKVSCTTDSYSDDKKTVLIKSYGEYLKYDEDKVIATYSAQIMAECDINTVTRTLSLKK
ncbi:MAG: hypothetical protein J6Z11_10770, partial [Candidatus Riflebacteria bacterium]|nr:hypothetical protein [Candidatus Riflebacteria bacterium]